MKRYEIMKLEGRELDQAVHSIMNSEWQEAPPYSTDIAAAWGVVEKLRSWHTAITISTLGPASQTSAYTTINSESQEKVWADTAPLAICRAALLAVQS